MGVLVPIVDISGQYRSGLKRLFPGEAFDVFESSTAYQPEEAFTFTFRVSLDLATEEGQVEAEHIREELRSHCPEEADSIIGVLDEHEWDVSFFADFY